VATPTSANGNNSAINVGMSGANSLSHYARHQRAGRAPGNLGDRTMTDTPETGTTILRATLKARNRTPTHFTRIAQACGIAGVCFRFFGSRCTGGGSARISLRRADSADAIIATPSFIRGPRSGDSIVDGKQLGRPSPAVRNHRTAVRLRSDSLSAMHRIPHYSASRS
jgi:hypothetical protein